MKWLHWIGMHIGRSLGKVESVLVVRYGMQHWPDEPQCEWMVPGTWRESDA